MRRLLLAALLLVPAAARAQVGTAILSVPSSIHFSVANVNAVTTGTPTPAHVSYNTAILLVGQRLRFSVQAAATNFTTPGAGGAIPSANVSWTNSNAVGGTASNGTLGTVYVQVYQSVPYSITPLSGSFDMTFTLAAPGTAIRAGTHSLTMQWKIEAI